MIDNLFGVTHNCVETRPYDGIGPLLERLRQAGVRTAVVSNKPDRTTRTLAARFFPELDGAMGQREGIASKPAPDMVRAALAQLHAAPEETLYVGDSEVDVLPEPFLEAHYDDCVRIPIREEARSLNLSNSVAIGVFEALRQLNFPHLRDYGKMKV